MNYDNSGETSGTMGYMGNLIKIQNFYIIIFFFFNYLSLKKLNLLNFV